MSGRSHARPVRIAAWFLAISYGLGAPVAAVVEFSTGALSERLGLAPELIYLACAVQLLSARAVLSRTWAPRAALALTVITVGAVGTHLTSGSPIRAIPAVLYTALQVWFGIRSRGV